MNLPKAFPMFLLFAGLTSCKDVIYTQPYLIGTFTGTHQPDSTKDSGNLPSFPIVIKSQLIGVEASRYTFAGTAELKGKAYTMTGFEERPGGSVMYFAPQAALVAGNFVMVLQDEEGSSLSICSYVDYGLPGAKRPLLMYGWIVPTVAKSTEACYTNDKIIGGFYDLEKR